jgi:dTDP-4-amino-4,6-dideoxygalactose transaminase
VDIGSSFLPSEITSAFLFAQLENLVTIQQKRMKIWNYYYDNLDGWQNRLNFQLPVIPNYATNNAHMFYIVFESLEQRTEMISKLKKNNISAVFHYLSLHSSPYYKDKYRGDKLPNSDKFSDCLLRLPLYYELSIEDVDMILSVIVS